MSVKPLLGDINLTAFMSSKICHDLVGPIGAINNGLELLEEETDEETRAYAHEVIVNSAQAAWTRLEFARLAFGASSGLGSAVDIGYAEKVARGFVEEGKHRLHWQSDPGVSLDKGYARLLMMMIAIAMPAVPGGGDIFVSVTGEPERPAFEIRCRGRAARIPERVKEIVTGLSAEGIDPRSVLAYYAGRLATELQTEIDVREENGDIVFLAKPRS